MRDKLTEQFAIAVMIAALLVIIAPGMMSITHPQPSYALTVISELKGH